MMPELWIQHTTEKAHDTTLDDEYDMHYIPRHEIGKNITDST